MAKKYFSSVTRSQHTYAFFKERQDDPKWHADFIRIRASRRKKLMINVSIIIILIVICSLITVFFNKNNAHSKSNTELSSSTKISKSNNQSMTSEKDVSQTLMQQLSDNDWFVLAYIGAWDVGNKSGLPISIVNSLPYQFKGALEVYNDKNGTYFGISTGSAASSSYLVRSDDQKITIKKAQGSGVDAIYKKMSFKKHSLASTYLKSQQNVDELKSLTKRAIQNHSVNSQAKESLSDASSSDSTSSSASSSKESSNATSSASNTKNSSNQDTTNDQKNASSATSNQDDSNSDSGKLDSLLNSPLGQNQKVTQMVTWGFTFRPAENNGLIIYGHDGQKALGVMDKNGHIEKY